MGGPGMLTGIAYCLIVFVNSTCAFPAMTWQNVFCDKGQLWTWMPVTLCHSPEQKTPVWLHRVLNYWYLQTFIVVDMHCVYTVHHSAPTAGSCPNLSKWQLHISNMFDGITAVSTGLRLNQINLNLNTTYCRLTCTDNPHLPYFGLLKSRRSQIGVSNADGALRCGFGQQGSEIQTLIVEQFPNYTLHTSTSL